jgi:hypothetical protein
MAARERVRVADKKTAGTQRVNLQVGVEAYQRLLIHCVMEKKSPGELVTGLIDEHLKRWKMPADNSVQANRSTPVASSVSAPLATEGKPNEAVAA